MILIISNYQLFQYLYLFIDYIFDDGHIVVNIRVVRVTENVL